MKYSMIEMITNYNLVRANAPEQAAAHVDFGDVCLLPFD
jgi:hypothetical protein